jgi:hypothetical protein
MQVRSIDTRKAKVLEILGQNPGRTLQHYEIWRLVGSTQSFDGTVAAVCALVNEGLVIRTQEGGRSHHQLAEGSLTTQEELCTTK